MTYICLPADIIHNEDAQPNSHWVEYSYRKAHPILLWLPSKLAEYIGDNYAQELGIPTKADPRKWSVPELNYILEQCLVSHARGQLRTFGHIQWECELVQGKPRARCFPFDLPGCRFYGKTRQVLIVVFILCITYIGPMLYLYVGLT